jgi:hypothetical protein
VTSLISHRLHARLSQNNSLHYQAFPAITYGIQFLDHHLPHLPQRLAALHHWLRESLCNLRYPHNTPFLRIVTGLPERITPLKIDPWNHVTFHMMTPSSQELLPRTPRSYFGGRGGIFLDTSSVGHSSASCSAPTSPVSPILPTGARASPVSVTPRSCMQGTYGYIIACIFLSPSGERLRPAHVSESAARRKIHLGTGCMYTSSRIHGNGLHDGLSLDDGNMYDDSASNEMVVRMSLGMGSDFEDIWNILRWAKEFMGEAILEHELVSWRSASASQPHLLSSV